MFWGMGIVEMICPTMRSGFTIARRKPIVNNLSVKTTDDPNMKKFATLRFALFASLTLAEVTLQAANPLPVAVTGFNRDVIVESTASGPPYNAFGTNLKPGELNGFYHTNLECKNLGLA